MPEEGNALFRWRRWRKRKLEQEAKADRTCSG